MNNAKTKQDLFTWINRMATNGANGLELQLELGPGNYKSLGKYPISPKDAEELWSDIEGNAQATLETVTRFTLVAVRGGSGQETRMGGRVVAIMRENDDLAAQTSGAVGFSPDRDLIRLLMELNVRQGDVIARVLPSSVVAATNVVNGFASLMAEMAQTQQDAVRALREDKASAVHAQMMAFKEQATQQRLSAMFEQTAPLLGLFGQKIGERLLDEGPTKEDLGGLIKGYKTALEQIVGKNAQLEKELAELKAQTAKDPTP